VIAATSEPQLLLESKPSVVFKTLALHVLEPEIAEQRLRDERRREDDAHDDVKGHTTAVSEPSCSLSWSGKRGKPHPERPTVPHRPSGPPRRFPFPCVATTRASQTAIYLHLAERFCQVCANRRKLHPRPSSSSEQPWTLSTADSLSDQPNQPTSGISASAESAVNEASDGRDAASDTTSQEQSGGSLKAKAAKGAVWSIVGYGGGQVLRFVGNLILTRLLFEEAFGIMALVNVFIQGLQLFSDIGIGPSIIQDKRGDDPKFLNTAWTIGVGRGTVLWLVSMIGAYPFAVFYGDMRLAYFVPVAGSSAFIAGFDSSKLHTQNRELAMGRLVLVELSSRAVGLAVMVGWALIEPTIWALVGGGVATSAVRMTLSHIALPGPRNRFFWDKAAALSLFRFGRWIFFSTLLTFLVGQSDRLIFGKMIPLSMLGVYSIALMISTIPSTALSSLSSRIVFPVYSRVFREGGDLQGVFRKARWPLLLVAGWSLAGLVGGGDTAVRLLYDERYAGAGWILQVLSLGSWFYVLEATMGAGLLAKGQPRMVAAAGMGKLLGMAILIPLGYSLAGFVGALYGFVASELFRYVVSVWAGRRHGLKAANQDAVLTVMVAISGAAGWAAAIGARELGLNVVLETLGVFLVVSAFWTPLFVSMARKWRQGRTPFR
jgi:O-antigen/teichoic acid export membrane protein